MHITYDRKIEKERQKTCLQALHVVSKRVIVFLSARPDDSYRSNTYIYRCNIYNLLKKSQLKHMYYIKIPTVRFMDLERSNPQGELLFEG